MNCHGNHEKRAKFAQKSDNMLNHSHHAHEHSHEHSHKQEDHISHIHTHKKSDHHTHSHEEHHKMMMQDFKKRFIISTILTVPILLLSPMIQNLLKFSLTFLGSNYILFFLSTIVYFYGGFPFLKGMIDEIKNKLPGMMTLISLAISVAYIYSASITFGISGKTFYWELATLIDIMLIGHYIEMKSVLRASRALEELIKIMPTEAHLITSQGVKDIPVDMLKKKDIVLVKPGEKIPSDGVIIEGKTSINESMLTGESKPVYKKEGDSVIGGSINLDGSIKVRIEKTGEEIYLMQVVKLIKQAQETKSKTQNLANKAAFWLTLIALFSGTFTLGIWLFLGKSFLFALERMVTVMVITCPHALGLAIPLVVAVSTSLSAKKGILIRDRNAFEEMRRIEAVVFDKTGTLTEGEFFVSDVISLSEMSEKDILKYAASLEVHSSHPIAQSIVKKAKELNLKFQEFENVKIIPGMGVKGISEGKEILLVSENYLKETNLNYSMVKDETDSLFKQGKTLAFLIVEGKIKGVIALADKIKSDSKKTVEELKKRGIKVYMLTGDNSKVADWVAKELNLDGYFAEVLPHEKSKKIKELRDKDLKVAMVGDGINDAPALVQADVGIAIGAGTDVAMESADIILVKSKPSDILTLIDLSKATYRKMKENLAWAMGYNVFAIPLAAGVLYNLGILLNPAVGALLMSMSTVVVAINARFLKV